MPSPVRRWPSSLARRSATPVSPTSDEQASAQDGRFASASIAGSTEPTLRRWAAAGAVLCLLPLGWATWQSSHASHGLAANSTSPLLAQLELGPAHDEVQDQDPEEAPNHDEGQNQEPAVPPPAPELPDGPADAQPKTDEPSAEDATEATDEVAAESAADGEAATGGEDADQPAESGAGSADYADQPSTGTEPESDANARAPGNTAEAAPAPVKPQSGSSRATNPSRPRPAPKATPPVNREPSRPAAPGPIPGAAAPGAADEGDQRKLTPPPTAPRQLSPRQQALKQQLEQCLQFYFVNKPLNTRDDSAWSIMHSFLGFGAPTPVAVGSPQGQRANAIAWMCANKPCGGRQLLYVQNGLVIGREGPGYQGHPAQFLAMLAQVHVSPDYELRVVNQRLTVKDLIESEKVTCRDGMELTFKLISLSHYLPSTATWQNQQGQTWDIPRLIRAEVSQPINGAACGGTHRLMGLSCAIYNRQQEGLPVDGQWARADKYLRDYHRYTFSLQNPDGSFSSDWFKRRANWGDNDRKLQTTGHIAEWMIYSVPEDELHDQRLFRAVQLLVNLMSQNRHYDWAVGPRGHAIRALRLYHERALGGRPADWMGGQMTRRAVSRSR